MNGSTGLQSGRRRQRGVTAAELTIGLAVGGLLLGVAMPNLMEVRRDMAMHRTARSLTALMVRARLFAMRSQQPHGVVFRQRADGWHCFVAHDGNGDGSITSRAMRSGADPIDGEILDLEDGPGQLSVLDGRVPDPGGSGWLDRAYDPVRAGRGDIITFTPAGTASPSSVYVSDGRDHMLVLRTIGATGRVRVLEWRRGWAEWKPVGW